MRRSSSAPQKFSSGSRHRAGGSGNGGHITFALLGSALLSILALAAGCHRADITSDGKSPPTGASGASPSVSGTRPPSESPGPSAGPPALPWTGPGTFTSATEESPPVGSGTPVRYRVQVEDSLDLSASETAREIDGSLADPRGWTAGGQGFRPVASEPAELTVRVASPGTVDAVCGAAGLDTQGEVNCAVDSVVMVNLKRWMLGSPQSDGPLHDYRALVVNHEVGHRLGHGHETCPGADLPAPVMMQQTKGLRGCTANAWPYDDQGTYANGPSVA